MNDLVTREQPDDFFPKKHYKRLLTHIRKLKTLIEERDKTLREARTYIAANISPFALKLFEIKFEILKILDDTYQKGFFTFWEKTKLHDMISQRAYDLSVRHQSAEADIIYQKYQKNAPDQGIRDLSEFSETLFKSFWGEIFDAYSYQAKENKNSEKSKIAERQVAQEEMHENTEDVQDTEKKLSASLKNIYTRLAKKLHPDLEQDAEKQAFKNELMQKITAAYKEGDLFELMQLAVENDCSDFEDLEANDLETLILLLKKQSRKLERNLYRFENEEDATIYQAFCNRGKVDYAAIEQQKELILSECTRLKKDLEIFGSESSLRTFLRKIEF